MILMAYIEIKSLFFGSTDKSFHKSEFRHKSIIINKLTPICLLLHKHRKSLLHPEQCSEYNVKSLFAYDTSNNFTSVSSRYSLINLFTQNRFIAN